MSNKLKINKMDVWYLWGLWILTTASILLSPYVEAYELGCSNTASDYGAYDSFTDTNGVLLQNHQLDSNNSLIGGWFVEGDWEIQNNQAYGDAASQYASVQVSAGTGNHTFEVTLDTDSTDSSKSLMLSSVVDVQSSGSWLCGLKDIEGAEILARFGDSNVNTGYNHIIGTWSKLRVIYDADNDLCHLEILNGSGSQYYKGNADPDGTGRTLNYAGFFSSGAGSGRQHYYDNFTYYQGDTCPAGAGANPSVTLSAPADNNVTSKDVNFTFALSGTGANSCELYTNATGTWASNATLGTLGVGTYSFGNTKINGTNGNYLWGVKCTNSSVDYWSTTNRTLIVDIVFPTITLHPSNEWNSNNLSNNNPYDNNFQVNISFADDRDLYLAIVEVTKGGTTYFNYTNNTSGPTFTLTNLTDISSWDTGTYDIRVAVADSHTKKAIKDYNVDKGNSKLKFVTAEGNHLWIETDDFSTTNAVKNGDRYSTEFYFVDQTTKQRTFHLKSDQRLDYLPNSEYPGHFVIWNGNEGNWIDFAGVGKFPEVTRVSDNHYIISFDSLGANPKFNSVGSLNTLTEYFTWYRGNYSSFAPNGFDGEDSTLYLNVTNGTGITNVNSTLVYNSVNYSEINKVVTPTLFKFDQEITNSAVANYSYYWVVTATQSDGTVWNFNTTTFTHMVLGWSLDNCAVNTNKGITFSNWLEEYITLQQNVSWELDAEYWLTSKDNAKNYSTALSDSKNLSLCVSSDMFADIYLQYTANEGFTHRWLIYNRSLVTSSTIQQKVYNFNTTLGISTLRITARDKDSFNFFPNAVTTLEHFYPSLNEWRAVQMGKSDDFGFVFFNVVEKSTDYRLVFRDEDNNLLKITDTLTFSCDSTICTLLALLSPYSASVGANNVSVTYNYNNNTEILTVNWISGLDVQLSSIVTHETGTGTTEICNFYSASTMVGSTTCNLSGYTGIAWLKVNSTHSGVEIFNFGAFIDLVGQRLNRYINEQEGAFYAFGIMVVVIGFGVWSPVAVIISSIFGLIVIYLLGLVSGLTITFLSIAIVLGVVLALKLRT